ncbi:MAG: hypothetical protein JSR21_19585 [Proteobacteria bacterium]|nr:hypothetical protein [Pseudomonadota bacterium]
MSGALLLAAIGVPLALLAGCASEAVRARAALWLPLAPLPGLAAALLAPDASVALPPALLGIRLSLDPSAAMLLGAASLLWALAGVYAAATLGARPDPGRFAPWWLLTLAGSLGVFMAADLVGFYLLFSAVSLAAYGLIVDDGTARARQVGLLYVVLAVLGEGFLLLAFVMLAQGAPHGSLVIRDVVAALPGSPWRTPALTLLILGFGVKLGMVPFHIWMPLTYRTAPAAAAAALSGAAVKAGVIGLLRFLPLGAALPDWGTALAAAGFFSAFWGVGAGLRQRDPRTVLAYSSISQMGVIAAVMGLALAAGDPGAGIAAALYGAHHTLVKGGLFLAVGLAATRRETRVGLFVLVPAAVIALGMAGLPLTGGALAKLAVKPVMDDGVAGLLGSLSSAGTAMLMLHFLARLVALPADAVRAMPRSARLPASLAWLGASALAVLVPWWLYLGVAGGSAAEALSAKALWSSLWPVLLGAALWLGLGRAGLMPPAREGDVVLRAFRRAALYGVLAGARLERADAALRRFAVALVALLAVALALAALSLGA